MDAILIAGPTASGKSALAVRLAERHGGVVINTDAMQVYDTLRELTARPDAAALGRAPHRLYGHVPVRDTYSTGKWLADAECALTAAREAGQLPIFVGGTGLYFRALMGGLSEIPAVPAALRQYWRDRFSEEGPQALHAALEAADPAMASRLRPGDGQRVLRALEVHAATGQSILEFQVPTGRALLVEERVRRIVLMPPRDRLHAAIAGRFLQMIENGAMAEVRAVLALQVPPAAPAMKAIGVRDLAAVEAGEVTMEQAIDRATAATRQYAKRQYTWFRNQLSPGWEVVESADAVN
jgi:tRNA dimethylallyltransferase